MFMPAQARKFTKHTTKRIPTAGFTVFTGARSAGSVCEVLVVRIRWLWGSIYEKAEWCKE